MTTKRLFVKGTEENCKEFTIDLNWYHSAAGYIGSINRNNDGSITLNLVVKEDRIEDVIKWSEKFGLGVI